MKKLKKRKSSNCKSIPAYREISEKTPNYTSKKGKFQDNKKVKVRKARI
jgi:hypothetical protein